MKPDRGVYTVEKREVTLTRWMGVKIVARDVEDELRSVGRDKRLPTPRSELGASGPCEISIR